MDKIGRRGFVANMLASSLVLLAPRSARAADARIEVLVNEPIGTISPEIYGHFIEHLGGVIYDGVWVGEQSKIPNIGVNTIHSLFLAYEDKFIATPNYHVFEMYSANQGGTSVCKVFSAPRA